MRINQSQTAVDNYHSRGFNTSVVQPQQQKILDVMLDGKTYTIGELAKLTGLDKSAVSGRRNAMLAAGLIERGAHRECKISGRLCETVKRKDDLFGACA